MKAFFKSLWCYIAHGDSIVETHIHGCANPIKRECLNCGADRLWM